MQKGFLNKAEITKEELELINKFTKRPLEKDEVYAFSVVLCDNDIDRDYERFSAASLETLSKLYIGKTGIFDHSMKGKDQVARIYSAGIEHTGEKCSDGQEYIRLVAKAYLPRTSKNEDFILNLDAGIMKEVSVGCAVGEHICSVCGTDRKKEFCIHQKGKFYGKGADKKQCHFILESPTDAYEWSFVAVPAQRKAGVIKSYLGKEKETIFMTAGEIIKGFGKDETITLSSIQADTIKKEFENLERICTSYLNALKKQAIKTLTPLIPECNGELLSSALSKLDESELKMFIAAKKGEIPSPQLKGANLKEKTKNSQFVI